MMAEETKVKDQEAEQPEVAAQEPQEDKMKLTHKGFGRYEVNGQKFKSKADAEQYVASQKAQEDFLNEFGDELPEGFDTARIEQNVYEYRGSLMEVPMNEMYAPKSGEYSPYYDRQWVWGWAGNSGTSISSWKATGWQLVSLPEVEKLVKDGKAPDHVLHLLREEGSYLVYGDNVLMRKPRALWRQQKAEKRTRSLRRIQNKDQADREFFERAGVGLDKLPVKNELTIRL